MSFVKKFAFGTVFSTGALMTYWYHYPRNFYENYKFVNKMIKTNSNKQRRIMVLNICIDKYLKIFELINY